MSTRVFICLLLSVVSAAIGQLLLRFGAAGRTGLQAFVNPWLLGGLFFYGIGTILWIWVLSRASLTLVYPFTALTIALVYISAAVFLGEAMTTGKLIGVGFIMVGLWLIRITGSQ